MVSADNVNLDVLELIFGYLSGNDLPSVALVCRSFFAGVIPTLYSTLLFRLSHAKRYPAVISPFAAVSAHPEFAIHVRHVDIRTIPVVKTQYNPKFLLECTHALDLCPNIISFRCSINALPPFIAPLAQKDRLRDLRIYANLTTDQSMRLVNLTKVQHLTLDFPSWNVLNLLPKWTAALQNNLTSLTLFMANELNETVLESALIELPGLLGLHVIGCPKVDHVSILNLVSHTPLLESLSMTTGESNRTPLTPPAPLVLPHLRHLALDARAALALTLNPVNAATSTPVAILTTILAAISASARLTSFVLKLPDRQMPIPRALVQQLVSAHAPTLRNVSFIECALGTGGELTVLALLCAGCTHLERLEVGLPVRELTPFTLALAKSRTLRTLVDVDDSHTRAGPALAQHHVRDVMGCVPSIERIMSGGRVWIRRKDGRGDLSIGLERRTTRPQAAGVHWFMLRE
ncbi:hypothetical protein DFH06DRAFT_1471501 [Mycena polygramma]|nr:hypothetical protein DFH06DRAFT_1471501 [Mycena polygramma]